MLQKWDERALWAGTSISQWLDVTSGACRLGYSVGIYSSWKCPKHHCGVDDWRLYGPSETRLLVPVPIFFKKKKIKSKSTKKNQQKNLNPARWRRLKNVSDGELGVSEASGIPASPTEPRSPWKHPQRSNGRVERVEVSPWHVETVQPA